MYGIFQCDLRAMAGLLLGMAAFEAAAWLRPKLEGCSDGLRLLLTAVELGCFLAVAVLAIVTSESYGITLVALLWVSVVLSLSGLTLTARLKSPILEYLGALALPVYCLQYGVFGLRRLLFPNLPYKFTLLVVLALSILLEGCVRLAKRPRAAGKRVK